MRVDLKNFSHAKKKKGVWQLDADGALDLDTLNMKVLNKHYSYLCREHVVHCVYTASEEISCALEEHRHHR